MPPYSGPLRRFSYRNTARRLTEPPAPPPFSPATPFFPPSGPANGWFRGLTENQNPSSPPQGHGLGKTSKKRGAEYQFHKSRFSLVGFFLPFMFVFRPELLMLAHDGSPAGFIHIAQAFGIAAVGVTAFAIGIAGHYFHAVSRRDRGLYFLASGLLLFPGNTTLWEGFALPVHDLAGGCLFIILSVLNLKHGDRVTRTGQAGGGD